MMEYLLFIFSFVVSLLINGGTTVRRREFKNILVTRLDHLGDAVLTLAAIRALRRGHSGAKITVLTGEWNLPLFKENADVNEVVVYNSPRFTRDMRRIASIHARREMLKSLRSRRYDLVVGFRDDFITVAFSLVLRPRGRIDRGTVRVMAHVRRWIRPNKYTFPVHDFDTNMSTVAPVTDVGEDNEGLIRFSDDEVQWLSGFLEKTGLKADQYMVLHPGAAWEYRRWSADNFAAVARYVTDRFGWRPVIIGTAEEIHIAGRVAELHPSLFVDISGKTTLREAFLLLSRARLVVCNDSGPMHVAAILNVPTIALLGPNKVSRFGPRGKNVLWFHKQVECHPCKQTVCKYPKNPCVNLITAHEVIRALEKAPPGFFDSGGFNNGRKPS